MVEFNPDGSLKLPASVIKSREETASRLKNQRCIKIRREVVSFSAPKRCILTLTVSEAITDTRFIENIFKDFKENATTPLKLTRIGEREFQIEVGSDFRRCSDCSALRGRYREFLDGNTIDDKGNCTFEGFRNFSYEDYFD